MTKQIRTTPTVNPDEMLPLVEKMIYSQVWKCSQTYNIPFEEVLSEAHHAFMKACYDYDATRGQKFSTWVYYWVWCKLKDMVTARTRDPLIPTEINEELVGAAPPERSESLELIEDLSGDAREIVSLLLETPAEVRQAATTARQLLHRVKSYLIVHGGWSKARVDAAHEEVHTRLNHVWRGGGYGAMSLSLNR